MGKASKPPVRVKLLISNSPRRSNRWTRLWAIGFMSGLTITAVSGMWIAIRFIVNPGSVSWLHWLVPNWEQQSLTRKILHTLKDVDAEVKAAGLTVGQPVYFSTFPGFSRQTAGFNDFLLPLYAEATCQAADRSLQSCPMVELRVYRPPTETLRLPGQDIAFELIDRLSVAGPEELAAIAPLMNADLASGGSTRRLPLRTITPLPGQAPLPGIWLHLSGEWQRGSNRVLYGQVIRYDPIQGDIQTLLAWTSPTQQFPHWQQMTGGKPTELLVDQTIGLEPQFQVYQFAALSSPGKPIQVNAIHLKAANLKTASYSNGLLLARHGLWSAALSLLQTAKQTDPDWSALAQSQLDFVALHANITRSQAQRNWDNPRSQIMALLIDGQWSDAFGVLRSAHANGYATSTLLANPSDRLWQRVEAAMRVKASPDLLNWGVLLSALRHDRETALAWRQTHAKTGSDRPVEAVLALLDPLPVTTVTSTSLPPASLASAKAIESASSVDPVSTTATAKAVNRLRGSARLQPTISPADWLRPDPTQDLIAATNQVWYEIEAIELQDGADWQRLSLPPLGLAPDTRLDTVPDTTLVTQLWSQLGLDTQPILQLLTWTGSAQPQIRQVMVKGVRLNGDAPVLLAVGDAPPADTSSSPSLAITLGSLSWIEPIARLTLADLSQQPIWSETLIPTLWQELQQTQQLPLALTDPAALLQQVGGWSVQLMELTGDNQPEAILSLQMKSSPSSPVAQPQTLILSNQGQVLFRDRVSATGPSLKAIVDLGHGPVLILGDAQGYWIEQWSD
jgi:hypothetical protein